MLAADVSDLPGENPHIRPVAYPLDILWEDEDLLLLNKPAGIAIHPSALTEETVTVAGGRVPLPPHRQLPLRQPSGPWHHRRHGCGQTGYIHRLCMESLHTDSFLREYRHLSGYAPALLRCHRSAHQPGPRPLLRRTVDPMGLPLPERSTRPFCRGSCPCCGCCLRRAAPTSCGSTSPPGATRWPGIGSTAPRTLPSSPRPALHSYRLRLLHPVTRRWLDVTALLPEDMRRLLPAGLRSQSSCPACTQAGSFSHPSSADGPYSIICRAKRCAFSRIPGRRTRLPRSLAASSRQNRGGR